MKTQCLTLFILLFIISTGFGQSTIVQTLTYDSTSRSMMVDFPNVDHNQYEKILMHYSMRCKNGEVSTGADRNKGCGEWDYSCNTNIIDSTRVDSFLANAPSHIIQGYTEDIFDYATTPTHSYYQSEIQSVMYTNVIDEMEFEYDAGSDQISLPLGGSSSERKSQYLFLQEDLNAAGLTNGPVTGLKFPIVSGDGEFNRLKIKLVEVEVDTLNGSSLLHSGLEEYFYDDVQIADNEFFAKFYRTFNFSGNGNILMEVSYSSALNNNIMLTGGSTNYTSALVCEGNQNLALHSEGGGNIEIEQDINFEGDEISISLWYFGSERLPANTTIFEGVDSMNRRQVNVHLPWSDGNIYWDCGNDGSGYDRVSKFADEFDHIKKWNHWTFTKNATTGFMRIYLNGESLDRRTRQNQSDQH